MSNIKNESGILVTLGQEKAFDRVDHEFVMRTLRKFGFGPDFCRWVSIFYNNVFSHIICNGSLSAPIFLGREVRQGCPIVRQGALCAKVVLVSEVLFTQIRLSPPGAGGL